MLAAVGLNCRTLRRIAIGPLKIKGLAPGEWRMLEGKEINALYKAAGMEREATKRRSDEATKGRKETKRRSEI